MWKTQYLQRAHTVGEHEYFLNRTSERRCLTEQTARRSVKKHQSACYLGTTPLHDNHSNTEKALIWALHIHRQSAERRQLHRVLKCLIEALQSEYVIASLWFKDEDNTLCCCSPLLTLQGVWGVNRMDAPAFGSASSYWSTTPQGDNPYFVALAYYKCSQ